MPFSAAFRKIVPVQASLGKHRSFASNNCAGAGLQQTRRWGCVDGPFPAATALRLHTGRNYLFQREPHGRARKQPECTTRDSPLNPFVKKKGCTEIEGDVAKQVWEHGRPRRSRSFTSLIFAVTAVPRAQIHSGFLPVWSQQTTCILYSVCTGILNGSARALQFWDRLGTAWKFMAFSRDAPYEYRALESHKGVFREVEASSVLLTADTKWLEVHLFWKFSSTKAVRFQTCSLHTNLHRL